MRPFSKLLSYILRSFICLLTFSWTLYMADSILLIVSSNGAYNSLAPWNEYTDASIEETETAQTSGTSSMTMISTGWSCTSTLAAAIAIMSSPDGKFVLGVVNPWMASLSFWSIPSIFAPWLGLSCSLAGIFLSNLFVASFPFVESCTSTAVDGSSIRAPGVVDSPPTTLVPSFVIARLSLINKQESCVDGFGCILLELTFSKLWRGDWRQLHLQAVFVFTPLRLLLNLEKGGGWKIHLSEQLQHKAKSSSSTFSIRQQEQMNNFSRWSNVLIQTTNPNE